MYFRNRTNRQILETEKMFSNKKADINESFKNMNESFNKMRIPRSEKLQKLIFERDLR